jgi:hypothetical protein
MSFLFAGENAGEIAGQRDAAQDLADGDHNSSFAEWLKAAAIIAE